MDRTKSVSNYSKLHEITFKKLVLVQLPLLKNLLLFPVSVVCFYFLEWVVMAGVLQRGNAGGRGLWRETGIFFNRVILTESLHGSL